MPRRKQINLILVVPWSLVAFRVLPEDQKTRHYFACSQGVGWTWLPRRGLFIEIRLIFRPRTPPCCLPSSPKTSAVSFCHKKEKGLPRSRASRTQKGQQLFFLPLSELQKCYGGFLLLTLQSYNATFPLLFFGSRRIWYRGRFPFHFSHVLSVHFFADCQDLPDEERKKVTLYLFAEK